MAEPDLSLVLSRLEAIQNDLRVMREEQSAMSERMDKHHLRISRDVSGLSRLIRHNAADIGDHEKRLELLEDELASDT